MTNGSFDRVLVFSTELRAVRFAGLVGDAFNMDFGPHLPGPLLYLKTGRKIQYEEWESFDYALERGWIRIDERSVTLTWAGEKVVRKWEKKGLRL